MSVEFDPTRYEVQIDPYPYYRRLRNEAPVYWIDALQAALATGRYIGDVCEQTTRAIGWVVDGPWELATSENLRFEEVEGERSLKRRVGPTRQAEES